MGKVSMTKSVITVLNRFEQTNEAISVVKLSEELSEEMNRTTVYRILKRLEDNGTLHSFIGKDGTRWYSASNKCSSINHQGIHPHFQCQECGKVECLTIDVSIPAIPNRKIESASLLLIGNCADCNS